MRSELGVVTSSREFWRNHRGGRGRRGRRAGHRARRRSTPAGCGAACMRPSTTSRRRATGFDGCSTACPTQCSASTPTGRSCRPTSAPRCSPVDRSSSCSDARSSGSCPTTIVTTSPTDGVACASMLLRADRRHSSSSAGTASTKLVEATLHPVADEADGTVVILRDIGDRERTSEALEQARRRFQQAFHSAPDRDGAGPAVRQPDRRREPVARRPARPLAPLSARTVDARDHPSRRSARCRRGAGADRARHRRQLPDRAAVPASRR